MSQIQQSQNNNQLQLPGHAQSSMKKQMSQIHNNNVCAARKIVLLADDDAFMRGTMEDMMHQIFRLQKWNFDVKTCQDGTEVVSFYRNNASQILCVFLDNYMEEMDGPEAATKIREAQHNNFTIPIFLLTGEEIQGFEDYVAQAKGEVSLERPLNQVFKKPLPQVEILQLLKSIVMSQ